MTWEDAISEYVRSMRAARRATGTIRLYRHYLYRLAESARSPGPWGVTTDHLRRFLSSRPGWSAETQKSARGAIVGFFRWAHLEGYVDVDPSVRLASVSVPAGVPRPAPETVVRRGLDVSVVRLRQMILLAAYGGLRCVEIAPAHRDDLVEGMLYVEGKGGKTRIVPIEHPELVEAFARAEGYLFPGRVYGHLSAGYVSKLLSDALEGDWTAHKLRHRFATRSHAKNPDLLALGRVLGHSRPETTQRYVQLSNDALLRVVRAAA